MTYIVSHVSPDWDAICSLWELQRFGGFEQAEIKLVNTGAPDPAVLAGAAAVVDTGREYDPPRWRFDHHQLVGVAANETCAAAQVWFHLNEDDELEYLKPLIELIYAGDTGKPEAKQSRLVGIHALLSSWKAQYKSDDMLLLRGYEVLDDLAAGLLAKAQARDTLAQCTVYRSTDGLFLALDGAPQGATMAAFEQGAKLVLWHSPQETTVAVGITRAPESGVDCGALVQQTMDADMRATYAQMYGEHPFDVQPSGLWRELETWYRHGSGFFAGRGTAKAPDARPLSCSVAELAAALDAAWERDV